MSEIEKMYENVGIEKVRDYYCPNCETKLEDWFGKHKGYICPNERCDYALCDDEEDFQECLEHLSYREKYPPFTAEKQIELIKWLILNYSTEITKGRYTNYFMSTGRSYKASGNDDLIICMANLINNLWQDLTEEEKQQVKGILE